MENKGVEGQEVRLIDVFKTLFKNLKWLAVALAGGIILGGIVGIFQAKSTKEYGTDVQFYINPITLEDEFNVDIEPGVYGSYNIKVMDNIIKLLQGESFLERLYLDENLLPEKGLGVDNKISLAENAIDAMLDKKADYEEAKENLKELEKDYNDKTIAYNKQKNIYNSLETSYNTAVSAYNSAVNSNAPADHTEEKRQERDTAKALLEAQVLVLNTAENTMESAKLAVENQTTNIETLYQQLYNLNKNVKEKRSVALEAWRETKDYETKISTAKQVVVFSYYTGTANQLDNLATSFIDVSIRVQNDEALAKDLLKRINEVLPKYVENAMPIPDGFSSTVCFKTTRLDKIRQTNVEKTSSAPLKNGLFLGLLAAGVVGVVFVVKDYKKGVYNSHFTEE